MDLLEGSKYAAAILGALLFAKCCDWFADAMYPTPYLDRPAYNVPGAAEPAGDLASLRLRWPPALQSPADRMRLLGCMRAMRQPSGGSGAGSGACWAPAAPGG